MTAVSPLEDVLEALGVELVEEPFPEPHPALVAAVRPTPSQVAQAAAVMGWLPEPEDRLFRPAVAV